MRRFVAPRLLQANAPRSYWFRKTPNFGDAVAPDLVEYLLGRQPTWVDRHEQRKLLTIGSVLPALRRGDVVLGSGLHEDRPIEVHRSNRILLVRGPLSRWRLGERGVPERYGDPGLLLPEILGILPRPPSERTRLGIIPHFTDAPALAGRLLPDDSVVIDVQDEPRRVVEAIAGCRAVVSTSLHGLIVAEALGIPAMRAELLAQVKGAAFKFRDYYLGTGREAPPPLPLEDAVIAARGATACTLPSDAADGLRQAIEALRALAAEGSTRRPSRW